MIQERERSSFVESLCREQPEVGNPKPTLQISCEAKPNSLISSAHNTKIHQLMYGCNKKNEKQIERERERSNLFV